MGRSRELSGKVYNWGSGPSGAAPASVAPTNDIPPVLGGAVSIGASPTVTPGVWSGTAPITYTYTLRRDGTPITGLVDVSEATIEAYVYVAADIGPSLTLVETATNSAGSDTATSNAVAFDPYTQPGWTECWDSTAGVTLVGSDVDEWEGRVTGLGIIEAVGGAGARPALIAASMGGNPVLRFDGSNDYLVGPIGASIAAGDHTMLLVARRTIAGSFGRLLTLGAGTVLRSQIRYGGTGELTTQVASTTTTTSTGGAAFALNDEATIAGIRDGASAGQVQVWRDGSSLAAAGTGIPASAMDVVSVGATVTGLNFGQIDVAFAGLTADAFSAARWADWTAYAAWRWGL